jgi:hypothetical protein
VGRIIRNVGAKARASPYSRAQKRYNRWIATVEPEEFLPAMVKHDKGDRPLFSIVIPCMNTPDKYLHPLIDSVLSQSFTDWELILGDGSSDSARCHAIARAAERDDRIRYFRFTSNTDISGNTNQTLAHANGAYVAFCDHDDTLSPHALNEAAAVLDASPDVDILYSNEDLLNENGKTRHSPRFKPSWSPHLFMQTNYTNHLSVVRRTLIEEVGGLRSEVNGAQDYDLLLRIHAARPGLKVHHIDKVLYHWRQADGSAAATIANKFYADDAGRSALQSYIDSMGLNGIVEAIPGYPCTYRHLMSPKRIRRVLILVSLSHDTADSHGFVLDLQNNTDSADVTVRYATVTPTSACEHPRDEFDAIFEFNAPAIPTRKDWLDRLVGVLELDNVADVSPRIISHDRKHVVSVGLTYIQTTDVAKLDLGYLASSSRVNGYPAWVRDVDVLTAPIRGYRTHRPHVITDQYSVVWSHVDFVLTKSQAELGVTTTAPVAMAPS